MVKQNIFTFFIVPVIFFMAGIKNVDAQEPGDGQAHKNLFNFNVRSFIFFICNDDSQLEPENPYDFVDRKTKLLGSNISFSYNVINGISLGIGSGVEKFEIPSFTVVPIFAKIALNGGDKSQSFHIEWNVGSHIIKKEKMGFLFRVITGYRFKIYKKLFSDISLMYTFQNIYKTFENSGRNDNYYNFESIGISAAFEIY